MHCMAEEAAIMYELWTALEQAREYKWVELSHPLDNDSPYWSGIPDGSVELSKMSWTVTA